MMTKEENNTHILFMAGLQYNAIYSETRHIGPPQCVYDDFTIGAFEMKVLHHLSMRGCSEKKMLILVLFHIRILFLVQMESFYE